MASDKRMPLPFITPTESLDLDERGTDPALARPASKPPTPPAPPMSLGALDIFLNDPSVTEIMVNDLRNVMIEKEGKMQFSGFTYTDPDELRRLVMALLDKTGKTLGPEQPYLDLNLPDGSRVNIVGPPVAPGGPCVTIRKFPARRPSVDDLVGWQMLDKRMGHFLHACIAGRMNVLISGGTDSGKTTLLNALAGFIPRGERVVTIEDTPELALGLANSVRMLTQLKTPRAPGVAARELVANALRMRPDRIVIGECRTAEAFDMLQAMNTGHSGSMTTIHANSPRDALARLETLCMMAGSELPFVAIRKQILGALDVLIQVQRSRNGKRRVTSITEVTGLEGETITLQDIFVFAQGPAAPGAPAGASDVGVFRCTGFVPTFLDRLREQGIELPQGFFA